MISKHEKKTLLKIKRLIDNGYTHAQIVEKLDVNIAIITNVNMGRYGDLPTFPDDPALKKELHILNAKILKKKVSRNRKPD